MNAARWEFGFLPESTSTNFDGWRVEPLDDFEGTLEGWNQLSDPQGWVLPPIIERVKVKRISEGEEVRGRCTQYTSFGKLLAYSSEPLSHI